MSVRNTIYQHEEASIRIHLFEELGPEGHEDFKLDISLPFLNLTVPVPKEFGEKFMTKVERT